MPDFVLELLTEEIPARMQARAAEALARLLGEALAARGVTCAPEPFVTPRRLGLFARGLPATTAATREERRGPRADAPEGAVAGFCKSAGVARGTLEMRDDPKGRFLYAVVERPGRAVADVLADAVPEAVGKLAWPKSMRWGAASVAMDAPRWVRPLTSVLALLDDAVVPLEALGCAAGRTTRGHRFMGAREPIEVASAAAYEPALRAGHVLIDAAERRGIIAEGARAAAAAAGLTLVEDESLVAENAGLTEWPVPLLGRFDPAFLEVPREVIQLTLRTNQKYFVLTDADGALAPAFVCVANIAAPDGGAAIVEGNRRVLAARLSDARFFWDQDRARPLEAYLPRLETVVFHEKLGMMREKAERVARLARWLAGTGAVPGADPDLAERAGRLAKADLVTAMVGEFPELQGVMGGYYAAASGEDPAVAASVRDHYRPVGPSDAVPSEPVSVAVALADKIDTLASFFEIGELPTGSRDPFALRRAALGILRLVTENELVLDVGSVVEAWLEQEPGSELSAPQIARRPLISTIKDFIIQRLAVQGREAGTRHDLIDASTQWDGAMDGRIDRLLARVRALQAFVETPDGRDLLTAYRRANNILAQAGPIDAIDADGIPQTGDEDPLVGVDDPAFAPLLAALVAQPRAPASTKADTAFEGALAPVAGKAAAAVEREDFTAAMAALAALRQPIDAFFEAVMVNDPDPALRAHRLGLLRRFTQAVHSVADFSRIEG